MNYYQFEIEILYDVRRRLLLILTIAMACVFKYEISFE